MTNTMVEFCEYRGLNGNLNITVASGQSLPAQGVGAVRFRVNGRLIKITDVLYVPGLDRKLLSIRALAAQNRLVQADVRSDSAGEHWLVEDW